MTESQQIRIAEHGGPEQMRLETVNIPPPQAGEVQIRQMAVGLNYIDTYHRSGLYPIPLPNTLGLEAAGEIIACGEGVAYSIGQRVAYGAGPIGAYASVRNMPVNRVTPLPDNISSETAAAMMLKGLTVQYLLRQTYQLQAGETILFHAAAGGVGLLACQWAKALGATIIGTVGSPGKAALAKQHGCDHTILYQEESVPDRVMEITNGKGVPVVYDGVGKATLEASLDSLKPRGLLVSFGNASGNVTNFDLGTLAAKGSLYVTRPTLMTYVAEDTTLQTASLELMHMVGSNQIKVPIHQRFALSDAQAAHEALESRTTTGTTILLPEPTSV